MISGKDARVIREEAVDEADKEYITFSHRLTSELSGHRLADGPG